MKLSEMKKISDCHPLLYVVRHGTIKNRQDLYRANTGGSGLVENYPNPVGTYSSIRPT
jgi:hypothetical protein